MKIEHVFPYAQAACCVGSFIVYSMKGDFERSVYWMAAAVLTISTMYMKG